MSEIDRLFSVASDAIQRIYPSDELQEITSIGIQAKDVSSVSIILNMVNAIKSTKGTNRVYFQDPSTSHSLDLLESLRSLIDGLILKLREDPDNTLPKRRVVEMLESHRFSDSDYYPLVALLSQADMATSAGRGRTGGLALYDTQAEARLIDEAEREIQETVLAHGISEEDQEKHESEHERVLYQSAAKFVTDLGYQAIILGVKRRLSGQWNTPDIVGYKINRFSVLCGGNIEVITVEVKWTISKTAIAETNSHQKLSHRSYLLVHQQLEEIETNHLDELLEKGIGLVCLKDGRPTVHSAAKRNHVDDSDIDSFLSEALDSTEVEDVKNALAKYLMQDTHLRLLTQKS